MSLKLSVLGTVKLLTSKGEGDGERDGLSLVIESVACVVSYPKKKKGQNGYISIKFDHYKINSQCWR